MKNQTKKRSKNNNILIVISAIILLIPIIFLLLRFGVIGGSEDDWIKNGKGIYIKHGNPSEKPENVQAQEKALDCARNLYYKAVADGIILVSQCLGVCGEYSIDIVNVPRQDTDDLSDNQCQEYKDKVTSAFIELDKYGNIARVVD